MALYLHSKNKNKNKILVQHYTTNHHVATICWQPFQTGKAVYYSSHKAEKTSGSEEPFQTVSPSCFTCNRYR
ncbi:hypothetical protein ACSQ67_020005 [Phaseolus vulgaris]